MRNHFLKFLNHSLRASLLAGVTLYLGYHVIQGENGVVRWLKITQQIESATIKLTDLSNKRRELENRVRLLRSGSLDPDLLEERARVVLNYADQNDQIIFVDSTSSNPH